MIINDKRELVYIATITDIKPLEGYDRVELATINDGWKVIVNKADNFKPNDFCVYFEVDSKVPDTDERFAFLQKRKYKIKTIKMCKTISQGLVMPLSVFPEIGQDITPGRPLTDLLHVKYSVDEDNVRKSNKPDPNAKYNSMCARHKELSKKGWWKWLMKKEVGRKLLFVFFGKKKDSPLGFPTHFPFVHKTDEERVENMPWVLGYKDPLIVTEKLDGTSTTFILERKKKNKFEFYVLSRNIRQLKPEQACFHDSNVYWEMAIKYNVEEKLKHWLELCPEDTYVCIQGETVGNVQGNPLKLEENDFYAFNFITSCRGRLDSVTAKKIAGEMGIKWVPILEEEYYMPNDMEEFKLYADAKSVINPKVLREGIVLRDPKTNLSFKNVSRQYLLKKGE